MGEQRALYLCLRRSISYLNDIDDKRARRPRGILRLSSVLAIDRAEAANRSS